MKAPKTLATAGPFALLAFQVLGFFLSLLMSCGLLLIIGAILRLLVWFFMEGWHDMGALLA